MDIESELYDSSRWNIERVRDIVLNKPELFDDIFRIALENKKQVSARAIRVLCFCIEKEYKLILPHINQIIKQLPTIESENLASGFLKIFSMYYLPEDEEEIGLLMDYCYKVLSKPWRMASMKVYSLEVLYLITNLEPELKQELYLTIKNQLEYELPSFQVRGRRIMRKIKKKPKSLNMNEELRISTVSEDQKNSFA